MRCGEPRRMRNRSLHEALRAFTEQAALTLDADTHAGAEIPFEVVEPRRAPARPCTATAR